MYPEMHCKCENLKRISVSIITLTPKIRIKIHDISNVTDIVYNESLTSLALTAVGVFAATHASAKVSIAAWKSILLIRKFG